MDHGRLCVIPCFHESDLSIDAEGLAWWDEHRMRAVDPLSVDFIEVTTLLVVTEFALRT